MSPLCAHSHREYSCFARTSVQVSELGGVLEEMKRTDEAIATYEYALSICPEEPHSLLNLAKLYRARGRDSDVRALLPRLSAITADSESLRKEVAEIVRQYGTIYL